MFHVSGMGERGLTSPAPSSALWALGSGLNAWLIGWFCQSSSARCDGNNSAIERRHIFHRQRAPLGGGDLCISIVTFGFTTLSFYSISYSFSCRLLARC